MKIYVVYVDYQDDRIIPEDCEYFDSKEKAESKFKEKKKNLIKNGWEIDKNSEQYEDFMQFTKRYTEAKLVMFEVEPQ